MRPLLFALAFVPALAGSACAADTDDDHTVTDGNEPTLETADDEIVSGGVSCRERGDTAYRGGRPYPIKVITVGGKPVMKSTGHAFLKMQAAAKAAGVRIGLSSGFRTMGEQEYLYGCYLSGRCNNGNLAARPGYSNHQNGLALDVTTSTWLAQNAGRFGFAATVRGEPWHYEHVAGKDPGGPCSRGADGEGLSPMRPEVLPWESPKQDGWYKNGVWMKVRTKDPKIVIVKYKAGNYLLGESTHPDEGFPVRYTFHQLGDRTLTAEGYDISGKQISESFVDVKIVE